MIALPTNPTVVILVDHNNNVVQVASNIAPLPKLKVTVTQDTSIFSEDAKGKTFNQESLYVLAKHQFEKVNNL